jgi:hypothetical protein
MPCKKEIPVAAAMVPIKTPDGQAELSTRQRRVSQRHRTVLLLVDGRRDELQVRSLAARAGVPDSFFGELLELGLIKLPEPGANMPLQAQASAPGVLHVDLPLDAADDAADSVLPAVRSLPPESVLPDSMMGELSSPNSWLPSQNGDDSGVDAALEEARGVLIRAVRAEAPVTGSLTVMRLRRARSRSDLAALLHDVELRISKPHRLLAAAQTLRHARHLLGLRTDSSLSFGQ